MAGFGLAPREVTTETLLTTIRPSLRYFARPVEILRGYDLQKLRADAVAGLTVTVILVPQAIAYAIVAGLPVQMGLYTAIVASIIGALWGSSNHLQTGPTNTASLLLFSVLLPVAEPGTPEFMAAAALITVMVGSFRLAVGLARLGLLVNFVSDSVIVGFTAGTGLLIAINQVPSVLSIDIPNASRVIETIINIIRFAPETHLPSLVVGGGTIVLLPLLKRFAPKLPGPLLAVILASVAVWLFNLEAVGVQVVGELPRGFPPFTMPPLLDLDLIGRLSTGALAISAIGLVEASSISRSIAAQTGQRLDSNQEFVGQGLANIAAGFFSGHSTSGSFARSAANFAAGGLTPMANVFCGLILLAILLVFGSLAAFLPRAAVAGVIIVAAANLIDRAEIARIWRSTRGDTMIMIGTFAATLLLPLEFAVLAGILISFARYILKTSLPEVDVVVPNDQFDRLLPRPGKPQCPQLSIIDIRGDLYFGAVNHVEEGIRQNMAANPGQRFLLLRLRSVNQIDISGIHMLETVVRLYRDAGGDVYFIWVQDNVRELMESTGFWDEMGEDHFLNEVQAVSHIFHHVLDPAVCIYECELRIFRECQNLPKPNIELDMPLHQSIPPGSVREIEPQALWQALHEKSNRYYVVDVREPSEFRREHVPGAESIPLSKVLAATPGLPEDQTIVFVDRSGRRSTRAAYALQQRGKSNVIVLRGGMEAWNRAGLLDAVAPDYWRYDENAGSNGS